MSGDGQGKGRGSLIQIHLKVDVSEYQSTSALSSAAAIITIKLNVGYPKTIQYSNLCIWVTSRSKRNYDWQSEIDDVRETLIKIFFLPRTALLFCDRFDNPRPLHRPVENNLKLPVRIPQFSVTNSNHGFSGKDMFHGFQGTLHKWGDRRS